MIWGMLLSHQMSASNDKLIFRGRCVRERNGTFRDDVVIRWVEGVVETRLWSFRADRKISEFLIPQLHARKYFKVI